MGDRLRAGKPSWRVLQPPKSTQPGHPSVGRLSEYQRKLEGKHTPRDRAPVSVLWQYKLVSG